MVELKVVFHLNNVQKTKALARGMLKENVSKLVLPVDEKVIKYLDPVRVVVDDDGELKIFDCVRVDNEYDLSKEPKVYLSTYGNRTDINVRLVEFIIENSKTVFDEECLKKLYELQNEALMKTMDEVEKTRNELRKREEEKKKRSEAMEVLKDLIDEYEKTISELRNEVRRLGKELDKKQDIIINYVKFLRKKGLLDEFIEFVKKGEEEAHEERIKEEYMISEED
jgi:uncharacterized protein (UPF0305 family)